MNIVYTEQSFHPLLENSLLNRKEEVSSEFSFNRQKISYCSLCPSDGIIHIMFDLSEKLLLPSFKKQPGCSHFTTGLTFYIFERDNSNLKTQYVFGFSDSNFLVLKQLMTSALCCFIFSIVTSHARRYL